MKQNRKKGQEISRLRVKTFAVVAAGADANIIIVDAIVVLVYGIIC